MNNCVQSVFNRTAAAIAAAACFFAVCLFLPGMAYADEATESVDSQVVASGVQDDQPESAAVCVEDASASVDEADAASEEADSLAEDAAEIAPGVTEGSTEDASSTSEVTENAVASDDGATATIEDETLPAFSAVVTTSSTDVSVTTDATVLDGTPYLYLPSFADLANVVLNYAYAESTEILFSSDAAGTFEAKASGSVFDLSSLFGTESVASLYYKLFSGDVARMLMLMHSANVAAGFIISEDPDQYGREYIDGSSDHSTTASGTFVFVDDTGVVVYNNDLDQIKGRGNSTWSCSDKKPYQIKLGTKTDLLQSGDSDNASKKWILLANASDATLLHNEIAYNLALELGLSYTPECRIIDLFYDGAYRGTYLICEKIEVGSGRVDIYDLEKATENANPDLDLDALPTAQSANQYGYTYQFVNGMAANPDDISGGYIIEQDNAYYTSERCWFETSVGHFVVKSPGNVSQAQMIYISEFVQNCINAVLSGSSEVSTVEGLGQYIDVDSFAKMFLVNEFAKNIDWGCSSTYYYLPSVNDTSLSHVLYAGPVWDFDTSFGTRSDGAWAGSYSGFYTIVIDRAWMINNNCLAGCIASTYSSVMYPILQNILLGSESGTYLKSLPEYLELVSCSQKMDETIWGLTAFENCSKPFSTYLANFQYLIDWTTARTKWMLDELNTWSSAGYKDNAVTTYNGVDYSMVYDYRYYIQNNADVLAATGGDEYLTLQHFVENGAGEGRAGNALFDVASYYNQYQDLRLAYGAGSWASYVTHYTTSGFREGRDYRGTSSILNYIHTLNDIDWSAVYDGAFYLSAYSDLANAFSVVCGSTTVINDLGLLQHFVNNGMLEARCAIDSFEVRTYRARYSDLNEVYGDNWSAYYLHYMNNGRAEGRNGAPVPSPVVVANAVTSGTVVLTWDAIAGATKYAVAEKVGNTYHTYTAECVDTTYTVSNLANEKVHRFLVQAYVDGCWSLVSDNCLASATPAGPVKPSPVATSEDNRATLMWDVVPGAIAYAIAEKVGDGVYSTFTTTCTGTSFSMGNLSYGTHYFLVQALIDGKWSSYTEDDLVSVVLSDVTAPVVIAQATGSGMVTLTWNAVSGAKAYAVAEKTSSGYRTYTLECTDTTYIVDNLSNGKLHTFLVQAYVNGSWSSTDDYLLVSATPTGTTKPSVTAIGDDNSVVLSWQPVPGATAYAIAEKIGDAFQTLTLEATDTTFVISNLSYGTHSFLVQANIDGRWSEFSDSDLVSVTLRDAYSPAVTAEVTASGTVTLTWDAISGATKYAVAEKTTSGYHTYTLDCTDTTYTVDDLSNGKTHSFLVQAYVNGSWSRVSDELLVSAKPTGATKPTVTISVNGTSVTLSWDAVPGATVYAVAEKVDGSYNTFTLDYMGTTVTIPSLSAGVHSFLVQAQIDGVWSSFSDADLVTATVISTLSPVVEATSTESGTVTLTWDAITSATRYAVAEKTDTGYYTYTLDCTDTTYTISNLSAGKTHAFLVQSFVNGSWSDVGDYLLVSVVPEGAVKPSPVAVVDGSTVTLTWDAVPGATAYAIAEENGTSFYTYTLNCTDTAYTVANLPIGTHGFLVQAKIDGVWSSFSGDDIVDVEVGAKTDEA